MRNMGLTICMVAFVFAGCSSASGDSSGTDGTTASDAANATDATDTTDGAQGTDGTDTVDGADTADTTDETDGNDASTGLPEDCDVEATIASLETTYFATSCALAGSCHKGPNPSGGLILDAGTAHANLVGVESALAPGKTLVVPGDPDASFLVQKVEGTMGDGEGQIMPLNSPEPLDPACRIAALRAWIAAGAPQ